MPYNHPALYALAKQAPDAALAVFHRLRDESCTYVANTPRQEDGRGANADDAEIHIVPDEPLTSETMTEQGQDGPDEIGTEILHEVTPDIHTMLRSAGGIAWPWCGERITQNGKVRWIGEPWAYTWTEETSFDGYTATLGGLTFYMRPKARRGIEGGMLVSYVDANGEERKPVYRAAKPRGGKRPLRTNTEAQSYLRLRGTVRSPLAAEDLRTPMSGQPALSDFYHPTAGAAVNAKVLADAYANTPVLPPVTKLPTGIAKGARFMGGLKAASQTASVPAPLWHEREAKPLGPVLEVVAERGSLTDIGIRLGYSGTRPDRAGQRALLAAGRALVAANDNAKIKVAA